MSSSQSIPRSSPVSHVRSTVTIGPEIITNLSGDEWDRAISGFADACYEQTERLQGAKWGDNRVRRMAISINGKIVAMALAIVLKLPILNRGLALVKFGPLWRRKGELPDRQVLGLALDALVDQLMVHERLSLSIMPPPDPRFAAIWVEELHQRHFEHRPFQDAERFLVNTALSPERQLASLDQRWRYNLKSALRNELLVGLEEPSAALADFGMLCESMRNRKNYSNPLWPLFEKALSSHHTPAISPALVLVREKGNAIAGAIIVQIGDTAYYAVGASNDRGIKLNAGYALQWWIVAWLRDRQCHWYDLGEAVPGSGLRQFKKGLVGKGGAIEHLPGEFIFSPDVLSAVAARLLLGVRRMRLVLRVWIRESKGLLSPQQRQRR